MAVGELTDPLGRNTTILAVSENIRRAGGISSTMSRSPVGIRTAGPEDLEVVAALHIRSRSDYYRGVVPDEELADPDRAAQLHDHWARFLNSADHRILLAEKDGIVLGMVTIGACSFPDPDPRVTAEMHMYVDPASFRQRVGTRLHQAAVQAWRQASVTDARLWVQSFNQRARAFYVSQGWVPDGHHRADSPDLLGYRLLIDQR